MLATGDVDDTVVFAGEEPCRFGNEEREGVGLETDVRSDDDELSPAVRGEPEGSPDGEEVRESSDSGDNRPVTPVGETAVCRTAAPIVGGDDKGVESAGARGVALELRPRAGLLDDPPSKASALPLPEASAGRSRATRLLPLDGVVVVSPTTFAREIREDLRVFPEELLVRGTETELSCRAFG